MPHNATLSQAPTELAAHLAAEAKQLALGKIACLWSASSLHRDWEVRQLGVNVFPAIELNQYLILESNGAPVAYCSWAMLTLEAEWKYLRNASSIRLDDWSAGDRMWIVDWVAPFAAKDSVVLKKALSQRFDNRVARALRVKPPSTAARVMQFHGHRLQKTEAKKIYKQYFQELVAFSATQAEDHAAQAPAHSLV